MFVRGDIARWKTHILPCFQIPYQVNLILSDASVLFQNIDPSFLDKKVEFLM